MIAEVKVRCMQMTPTITLKTIECNYLFCVCTCERSLPVRVQFTKPSRIGVNKQLDDIHGTSVSGSQMERKRLAVLCMCLGAPL